MQQCRRIASLLGMEGDVSSYPLLLETLRDRKWSSTELAQVCHGNVLRAMRDMEAVADTPDVTTPELVSGRAAGAP